MLAIIITLKILICKTKLEKNDKLKMTLDLKDKKKYQTIRWSNLQKLGIFILFNELML